MEWQFQQLRGKKIQLGSLKKKVNDVITNYSVEKGSEPIADMIIDSVWLGKMQAADSYKFVMDKRIKCIINVSDVLPRNEYEFINYSSFPIRDQDMCNPDSILIMEEAADLIHDAVTKKKPILVHCKNGHHRSASVVTLYLMKYRKMSLVDAMYLIKQVRPTALRKMKCTLDALINYEYERATRTF